MHEGKLRYAYNLVGVQHSDIGSDTDLPAGDYRGRQRRRRPVSDDYGPADNEFTGRVNWAQIDVDKAAEDIDLISPEERFHLAVATRGSPQCQE